MGVSTEERVGTKLRCTLTAALRHFLHLPGEVWRAMYQSKCSGVKLLEARHGGILLQAGGTGRRNPRAA